MTYADIGDTGELVVSRHSDQRWQRRRLELAEWMERPKVRRKAKQTARLGQTEIDAELLGALTQFKRIGIATEFSCAGVSVLDEPEDHSLYAYITFISSPLADRFVQAAMAYMKHRLLVTFEPARGRYDCSSFLVGHNRSFCMLIEKCARDFAIHQ
ncbi:hypothetical protein SAMN05216312_101344 [Cohnella sp. OV330]|uniref:hypothetical protein n=1 Tax=Cohnella sp. OV330 TaxID=1855288 RepID=UPI0008F3475F|nr:hypothetical protein [Cohnella sp. OV330]SFA76336.1 hypothetical protein SAMN05216312_101344 [Cohnella sp. OV330]